MTSKQSLEELITVVTNKFHLKSSVKLLKYFHQQIKKKKLKMKKVKLKVKVKLKKKNKKQKKMPMLPRQNLNH